jgi:hypothetical protein
MNKLLKTSILTTIYVALFIYLGHLISQEINGTKTPILIYIIISYIATQYLINAFHAYKAHLTPPIKHEEEPQIKIKPLKISSGHIIEFNLEQTVFIKNDVEQIPAIIRGINLHPFNAVMYELHQGKEISYHYAFELSTTKDTLLSTSY